MKKITSFRVGDVKANDEFEFQEVGVELEPYYGKLIWTVFYRADATERRVREAHKVCLKKKIFNIAYLIGVMKRLP